MTYYNNNGVTIDGCIAMQRGSPENNYCMFSIGRLFIFIVYKYIKIFLIFV